MRINLNTSFLIGTILTILLLSLSLTILSVKSIKNLKNFTNRINKKNIVEGVSKILFETNKDLAKQYSSVFNEVESYSQVLARQTEYYLNNKSYYDKPDNYSNKLLNILPLKNYFSNNKDDLVSLFYWNKGTVIPDNVMYEIRALSYIFRLIYHTNINNIFTEDVWVNNLCDKYMVVVPNFYDEIKNIDFDKFTQYQKSIYNKYSAFYRDNLSQKNKSIWILPDEQFFSDRRDVSVKTPFFVDNEFKGFTGIDIDINVTVEEVLNMHSSNNVTTAELSGDSFLLTENGRIAAIPKNIYDLFLLPHTEYKGLLNLNNKYKITFKESRDHQVRELFDLLLTNNSGITELSLDNDTYLIAYCRIPTNNWIAATIISLKSNLLPLELTNNEMHTLIKNMYIKYFSIAIAFIILALVISLIVFNYIIKKPISNICDATKKIGDGNFSVNINKDRGTSEIRDISESLIIMTDNLKSYIKRHKTETRLRLQIESEIKIASQLQYSVLPEINDDFNREEFDLYAELKEANNMSGDFYDLFYLDKDTLVIVIADISGKGISAAFYMSLARVVIKCLCLTFKDLQPGQILAKVNEFLFHDNKSSMFLTGYLFFYNTKTGRYSYANSAHPYAKVLKSNTTIKELSGDNGFPLGVVEDAAYESYYGNLNVNDAVLFYTDGVIEAKDSYDNEFGDKRLNNFFKNEIAQSSTSFIKKLLETVIDFQAGNKFDDITAIILKRLK